ncbi:MAG: hypothetical protein L0H70_04575, partial [Xanthomonadales bacterium]|nr:hypothetical protein [Xanthomonadales bacterium]
LSAAVILGACGVANASGQMRINDGSGGLPLTTAGTAVSYAYNSAYATYIADVKLQGFLFCNHVATAQPTPIDLVARHGAWTYGSASPGDVAPVSGINNVAYAGETLQLTADASTQCFRANEHGLQIADMHHIFTSGFDFGAVATSTPNTSAVTIAVDHLPAFGDTDDRFRYTVTVAIGGAVVNMGQAQTHSQPGTDYFLNEGYDTAVFSSCNIVPGQSVTGSMSFTRACIVRPSVNIAQSDGTVPVVTAALFTGPSIGETDFNDNLAFGYPAVTP